MEQMNNYIIIAIVLILLAVIVLTALVKRAKNDPESLENKFFSDFDMYDAVENRGGALVASRAARPVYPDPNDPRYIIAKMKEKQYEERMKKERIEDIELWEESRR